jgi:hypothetical protein
LQEITRGEENALADYVRIQTLVSYPITNAIVQHTAGFLLQHQENILNNVLAEK